MPRMAVQKKLCTQQSVRKNVKNPKLLKISKENKCIYLSTCIIYIKCRNNTQASFRFIRDLTYYIVHVYTVYIREANEQWKIRS